MPEQLSFSLELGPSRPQRSLGPVRFRAGIRVLEVTECFDVYWQFAAERQRVFHRRAAGMPSPWTNDPILAQQKFTSVYRAADRVSQYLIRDVIYRGSQHPDELMFRILLFKIFNRIETWELLKRQLGSLTWADYRFAAYNGILNQAMSSGERVYSAAYIIPNPSFGESRKHGNHLRLIEHAMTTGLPEGVASARDLREIYDRLVALPSLGPFLAYQYAIDVSYSPLTAAAQENQFVVAGPGALDGISKCFADTGGLTPAEVIAWMNDTSDEHFSRLGERFEDLWGRWPTLIDWQNVFCEVSKYTRLSHPHVRGLSGRTRIKQKFRPTRSPIDYRFPPKWGLPPGRTAIVRDP
jgi:alpha-glutamyl/putrescinyl thymine pyrophosphorylase clade 1